MTSALHDPPDAKTRPSGEMPTQVPVALTGAAGVVVDWDGVDEDGDIESPPPQPAPITTRNAAPNETRLIASSESTCVDGREKGSHSIVNGV